MDVGYYVLLSQATSVHVTAGHCVIEAHRECVNRVSAHVWTANDPADRDNFRSLHAKTFSTPEPFEFQPHHADTVCALIPRVPAGRRKLEKVGEFEWSGKGQGKIFFWKSRGK